LPYLDGDAYKNYLEETQHEASYTKEEFINLIKTDKNWAMVWGELGPIYGYQWREWGSRYETNRILGTRTKRKPGIDQIQKLIQDLKTNPDSRRLMVNAWNVGEINQMVLPPCHYGFQVYTRELTWEEQVKWVMKNTDVEWENLYIVEEIAKDSTPKRAISLMWNQRSVDTPLGLPFNIASYALLLEILARETNMIADQLIGNLGDCHIYLDQQDGVREQLTRSPMALGQLVMNDEFWNPDVSLFDQIEHIQPADFYVENYQSHSTIKFPLSN